MAYINDQATTWDVSKLLAALSEEEKAELKEKIAQERALSNTMKRKYNTKLLSFVEGRLNKDGEV